MTESFDQSAKNIANHKKYNKPYYDQLSYHCHQKKNYLYAFFLAGINILDASWLFSSSQLSVQFKFYLYSTILIKNFTPHSSTYSACVKELSPADGDL